MLKIQGITKKYDNVTVLDGVSFELEGGVLGVIGADGVGKSTLLGIIAGAIEADDGKVFIDGYDISEYSKEAKKATGYLSENMPFYDDMSAYEFLSFVGEAKRIPAEKLDKQILEALDLLRLTELRDVLIANIDKSARVLLGVAMTLLGNPDVIILDEPFKNANAADAVSLSSIIKMLGTLKTVIICAESASAVKQICSRFLVLGEKDVEPATAPSDEDNNEEKEEAEE